MPDTFTGHWHRPTNPQRGHSLRQLQEQASYDNQPQTSYSGCLLIATILTTAAVASLKRRT